MCLPRRSLSPSDLASFEEAIKSAKIDGKQTAGQPEAK
jgi:hypothetical protein